MLKPETFAAQWQQEVVANEPDFIRDDLQLIACPPEAPVLSQIPEESARFLVEAGLPSDSAPFLSFDKIGKGLPSLTSVWRLDGVSGVDHDYLSRYYTLGSDGAGNPLCIDIKDEGKIYMVDHEDAFRTRLLVASSVPQLAEALLIINTHPREDFRKLFEEIDPDACGADSFLPSEVETLIEEA